MADIMLLLRLTRTVTQRHIVSMRQPVELNARTGRWPRVSFVIGQLRCIIAISLRRLDLLLLLLQDVLSCLLLVDQHHWSTVGRPQTISQS